MQPESWVTLQTGTSGDTFSLLEGSTHPLGWRNPGAPRRGPGPWVTRSGRAGAETIRFRNVIRQVDCRNEQFSNGEKGRAQKRGKASGNGATGASRRGNGTGGGRGIGVGTTQQETDGSVVGVEPDVEAERAKDLVEHRQRHVCGRRISIGMR